MIALKPRNPTRWEWRQALANDSRQLFGIDDQALSPLQDCLDGFYVGDVLRSTAPRSVLT